MKVMPTRRTSYNVIYRTLEGRPDSYQDWYQQGNGLRDAKRYEEAIASYDKALEYKPHDYWAWYWRADILDILGRYEEAIASYDKALEDRPTDYWAWCHKGSVLRQLDRYEKRSPVTIKRSYRDPTTTGHGTTGGAWH
jgi:tetratricopeptide (TPR) repeat protein